MTNFKALFAPFDPSVISWRVGSSNKRSEVKRTGDPKAKATKGMALAYLDARAVMDRLDEVCGPEGWQCKYTHAGTKTVCDIGICIQPPAYSMGGTAGTPSVCIPREWAWKADGAGDSDIEAEKGALSDAFKRAAVRWGIGRYLYDLESPWVQLDEWEHIKDSEYVKLKAVLLAKSRALGLNVTAHNSGQAIAEAHADIVEQTGSDTSVYRTEVESKAKDWANAAISSINLGDTASAIAWARAADEVPKGKRKSPLQWLEDNAPDQFVRVNTAYTNVTGEGLR